MGDSCASIRVICCRRPHRRRSCNSVITTALAAGMHWRGRNLLTARPAPSPRSGCAGPRGVSARPSAPLSSRPSVSFAGCAAPARPGGQTNAIIRHGARWEPHAGYAGPSADSPGKGPGVAPACMPRPLHNGGDDHFSAARPAPLDSRSEEAMTVMTSWGHQPHQLARTAPWPAVAPATSPFRSVPMATVFTSLCSQKAGHTVLLTGAHSRVATQVLASGSTRAALALAARQANSSALAGLKLATAARGAGRCGPLQRHGRVHNTLATPRCAATR